MKETPPWDWPEGSGKRFLEVLRDRRADEPDRLLAAELAGSLTAISDELADALVSILGSSEEAEQLRATAAISLGPAIDYADQEGFEDPHHVPISEGAFRKIQQAFHEFYLDDDIPKQVRRRILEASVRAPRDWHQAAIRSLYSSADDDWKLTAVFCMRWVRGFDDEILEALGSGNPEIHYEAVWAAGEWQVDGAWSHLAALVKAKGTDKDLLLAAIEAVGNIRPKEAGVILVDLTDAEDEDIVAAAHEAMAITEGPSNDEYEDEDDSLASLEDSDGRSVRNGQQS